MHRLKLLCSLSNSTSLSFLLGWWATSFLMCLLPCHNCSYMRMLLLRNYVSMLLSIMIPKKMTKMLSGKTPTTAGLIRTKPASTQMKKLKMQFTWKSDLLLCSLTSVAFMTLENGKFLYFWAWFYLLFMFTNVRLQMCLNWIGYVYFHKNCCEIYCIHPMSVSQVMHVF